MPENWKTHKLEQLVTKLGDGIHGTPKYTNNGKYYFINGNNLVDGKILIKSDTKRVSKEEFLKHKRELNNRTLLVSINGTIGRVAYYNGEQVMLGKSACYFNVKETVDKIFIKQVISSRYFMDYLESNYTGSVIKNVSLKSMREMPIHLPPLPEQHAIASILSALDDKIENNLSMNKTLEAMAMALYKNWFVDFGPFQDGNFIDSELGLIPEGWEVKELKDFAKLTMGQSPKSIYYNDERLGLPFHQGVKDYGMRFPTDITYSTEGKRKANAGDILISVRAPVGRLNIAEREIILGRGLAAICFPQYDSFMFCALQRMFAIEDSMGSGTVYKSVNKDDLQKLKFVIPNEVSLKSFQNIASPMNEKYKSNHDENIFLAKLRDTLLPKLISGEVRVKDIEKTIREVV